MGLYCLGKNGNDNKPLDFKAVKIENSKEV